MFEDGQCDVTRLLSQIRTDKIFFDNELPCYGSSKESTDRRYVICTLNMNFGGADEFEQVMTLLHEYLHYDPRFKNFAAEEWEENETAVEAETFRLLSTHLRLFDVLLLKLNEAKAMEIRRSVLKEIDTDSVQFSGLIEPNEKPARFAFVIRDTRIDDKDLPF